MRPDDAGWTLETMLLATAVDTLRWLQWAQTEDGHKGRNQPDPIPRPGVKSSRKAVQPAKAIPRSKLRRILQSGAPVDDGRSRGEKLRALFTA